MDRNFQHENEIWSIRSTLPNWKRSLDWQWWKSSSWWRIHPSSQASPGLSSQQQCHCLYLWYLSSCVYPQRRRHCSCGWEGIDASFSPHKYSSVSPMVPTLIRCISLAMVLLLSSVRTPSSPSKWRSARRTRSTSSGVLFYFTLFYVLGTDAKFSEVTSVQPVYDSLGDDCLAMSLPSPVFMTLTTTTLALPSWLLRITPLTTLIMLSQVRFYHLFPPNRSF